MMMGKCQVFSWPLVILLILSPLFINYGDAGQPPKISEHPADSVVPRNEPVTLNCKGEGDPPPSVSWTKDGKSMAQAGEAKQMRFTLPSGSLFFLRVRSHDAGVYACTAWNSFGKVTSRNATLEVATLRDEFRATPQNSWKAEGETALLTCEPPRGNPEPKVFWKKNGQLIDLKGNGRFKIVGQGSLSISELREDDEGLYVCVAKSIVGMRHSNSAHLRITVPPKFTIVPANTTALIGSDVALVCVARGDPPPEISWNKESGFLPLKRARFDEERFLISNVTVQDGGIYQCVAENKAGSIVSSATITILSPPTLPVVPNSLEVQPNSTVSLECGGEGDPLPILFWSKEGTHSLIFQGTKQKNFKVSEEGTLTIENVTERDEGFWFCAAVSYAGSAIHKIHIKVTPLEDLPPPIIRLGGNNESRVVGDVALFPCQAQGHPPPIITWYKNSLSFNFNHRIFTDESGTLRINDLSLDDGGMYECVASSRSGKYAWKSFLTVLPNYPVEGNSTEFQNGHHKGHRMDFSGGDFVLPSPMKPHILKVDANSITLAWHPKYFNTETVLPSTQQPFPPARRFSRSHPIENQNDEPGNSKSGAIFQSGEYEERSKIHGQPNEKVNEESEEEEESEYGEEKEQFEEMIEKLEKIEEEEEDEERNPNGNNLIIQSTKSVSDATSPLPPIRTQVNSIEPIRISPSSPFPRNGITFSVEYFSPQEVRGEWLLGAKVPTETVTLQYLLPNADYVFFVRSVSGEGILSPPSPLSDPVRTSARNQEDDSEEARGVLEGGIVVLLKTAYATSSTTINIQWQIVSAGELIEGFYLIFRPTSASVQNESEDSTDSDGHQILTILNTGLSTFTLSGLEKYTTYQIFLIPFYKNVDGRPSNYLNITTSQDVPSEAPEILDMVYVNNSAITIRWKSPPTKTHHGIITGYQLRVWSGSSLVGNRTTDASTFVLVLNNLTPGKSYSLQIGSFTVNGIGTFSPMETLNFNPEMNFQQNNIGGNKNQEVQGNKEKGPNFGISDAKGRDIPDEKDEFNEIKILNRDLINLDERDKFPPSTTQSHPDDFLSEVWFIALIGSLVFLLLLVFVFALHMRRSHIKRDVDKFKAEIPDGSMPPRYPDDNLWLDPQHTKQPSYKSPKTAHDQQNEYENGNNYAVVEDQHSPIAYASTTLISGDKNKSTFGANGETGNCMLMKSENGDGLIGRHFPRGEDFGNRASHKIIGWGSRMGTTSSGTGGALPASNKTGSLNIDIKKDAGKGTSLNMMSTFQTPLPRRREMLVDYSSDGQNASSILKNHKSRLNFHPQFPQNSHPQLNIHNGYINRNNLL